MKKYLLCAAIALTVFGCNSEKKELADLENLDAADTTSISKIIKTADMRFRVKDVQSTKEQLSEKINEQGGAIAEFSIQSSIKESDKVKYTTDSLKEIISYQREGFLVAKVPSEKLDDFTNSVAHMAIFVDNQAIKMDDQSIVYLSNKLKNRNRANAASQIDKIANKRSNIETSLSIKDDYVDRKIENLAIDNRVKFSTITLSFYQDNTIKTFIVTNDDLYSYKPSFFQRLGLNLLSGWTIFKELLLGLANLWMFILIAFIAYFTIRYYNRKNKLAVVEATSNMINNNQKQS